MQRLTDSDVLELSPGEMLSELRSDNVWLREFMRDANTLCERREEAEPTAPGMPSYGGQLDDHQIAAVLNYVRNSWGSASLAIEATDVTRVRSQVISRAD
jgi:hypothetical protein